MKEMEEVTTLARSDTLEEGAKGSLSRRVGCL